MFIHDNPFIFRHLLGKGVPLKALKAFGLFQRKCPQFLDLHNRWRQSCYLISGCNMSSGRWTRPNDFPYPNVWRWHEGKKEIEGKTPRFRIQDASEEYHDEIIEHMSTVFLIDEPICSSVGIADDPVSLKEFQDMWREYLQQRVAVVAIVEPDTTPYTGRVAGCNLLGITYKSDVLDINKYKGEGFRKLIEVLEFVNKRAKIFEKFGVDFYMARFDLGRALGIPVTSTLFSPPSTQWMGGQCGMETLVELNYEDYKDDKGRVVFQGIPNKKNIFLERNIPILNFELHEKRRKEPLQKCTKLLVNYKKNEVGKNKSCGELNLWKINNTRNYLKYILKKLATISYPNGKIHKYGRSLLKIDKMY
ncbi:hypothetical protein C0J52_18344 [Blattella germanica]|nr:hypothetical protein C0J52_18344 [Blattella germanica]